jgi:ferredoxin
MQFKQLRSFRLFVFLLLTIFFTDTVYASGMMVADQLCDSHTVSIEILHDHDDHDMVQHAHHQPDEIQKQSSNDHCSKCGHCMACFTVLPPSQIENIQLQHQTVEVSLFQPSYNSHISAQPHRPPIA